MAVSFIGRGTGVPRENHLPAASHWQTISHNIVSITTHLTRIRIHNDCIGSCKSNNHTITTTIAPYYRDVCEILRIKSKIKTSISPQWNQNIYFTMISQYQFKLLFKCLLTRNKCVKFFTIHITTITFFI